MTERKTVHRLITLCYITLLYASHHFQFALYEDDKEKRWTCHEKIKLEKLTSDWKTQEKKKKNAKRKISQ